MYARLHEIREDREEKTYSSVNWPFLQAYWIQHHLISNQSYSSLLNLGRFCLASTTTSTLETSTATALANHPLCQYPNRKQSYRNHSLRCQVLGGSALLQLHGQAWEWKVWIHENRSACMCSSSAPDQAWDGRCGSMSCM